MQLMNSNIKYCSIENVISKSKRRGMQKIKIKINLNQQGTITNKMKINYIKKTTK